MHKSTLIIFVDCQTIIANSRKLEDAKLRALKGSQLPKGEFILKKNSVVLFLCVFLFLFNVAVYGQSTYSVDLTGSVVEVSSESLNLKSKVIVEKGNERYYYNLNKKIESIPLQLGNGSYLVKIVEHLSGNKYKVVKKNKFNIEEEYTEKLYTGSNQPVYWVGQEKIISLGNKLTKNLNSGNDKEKVEKVYNYIVDNISYDYNKINTIDSSYVPKLDKILTSKNGICYDYASLFAGILRSQGIPTKLIKGYKTDLKRYHAWNEVFLDGKWLPIDTTYDAALKGSKTKVNMIKQKNEYKNLKVY